MIVPVIFDQVFKTMDRKLTIDGEESVLAVLLNLIMPELRVEIN